MGDSDSSTVSSTLDLLCKTIYVSSTSVLQDTRGGEVSRLESLDDISVFQFIKDVANSSNQLYSAALRNTLTVFEKLMEADIDLTGENNCAKHLLSPWPVTCLSAGEGLLYYPDGDETYSGKFAEEPPTDYGAICTHIGGTSGTVTLRKNHLYLLYGNGAYRSVQCEAYAFDETALQGTAVADAVDVELIRASCVLRCISAGRGRKFWRQLAKKSLFLCEKCTSGENAGEDGLLFRAIRGERPNCSVGSILEYAERTGTSNLLVDTDNFAQQQCLAGKVSKIRAYHASGKELAFRRMAKVLLVKEANERRLMQTPAPIDVTYADLSSLSGLNKAGVALSIATDAEVGSKFCEDNLCYSPFARGGDRPFRLVRCEELPCELLRLLFGIRDDGKSVCIKTGKWLKISVSGQYVYVERGVECGVLDGIATDIMSMKVIGKKKFVEGAASIDMSKEVK